jgi:hypothetical protein
MGDERSGVFVVSKIQGPIVALLCGFFPVRPREEQIAELEDSNLWGEPVDKIVERSSSRRVRIEHTVNGIPVMVSKHPRVFQHRKLHAFADENQVRCDPVPRSFLENLAEGEGSTWLKLPVHRRLDLLDFVVQLYRKTKPEAA